MGILYLAKKPYPEELAEPQKESIATTTPSKIVPEAATTSPGSLEVLPAEIPEEIRDKEPVVEPTAPLSPSVLHVPEEPALPPSEEDIINLDIFLGRFNPQEIILPAGEGVILRPRAKEGSHIFTVPDLNIGETIQEGKSLVISFRAPQKPQKMPFYCAEPGHKEAGEEGIFIIR